MKITRLGKIEPEIRSGKMTVNQVTNLILFGGEYAEPVEYDPTKTYNIGDPILYIINENTARILTAKHDGITGEFNMDDWEVLNIAANQSATDAQINNAIVDNILGL